MSKKLWFAAIGLSAALALTPFVSVPATAFKGQGTAPQVESMVELTKAKKKTAKKKAKKKKSMAGRCGTYKYWNKKAKKCVDARVTPVKK